VTVDVEDIEHLVAAARRILEDGSDPTQLAGELAEAGVTDLAGERALTGALLTAQGETLGRSTLLDALLAGRAYRPGLRVVLPLPGSADPPAAPGTSCSVIVVRGLVFAQDGVDQFLVHTGSRAALVPAEGLVVRRVDGLDPSLRIGLVTGTVELPPREPSTACDWERTVELGRRALAHELVGVGERALNLAISHVTTRTQFGVPIATLQSVRHRLVDAHVMLQAARAVLGADQLDPHDDLAPPAMKAIAGRAALEAVAVAQQVCGAMGFTAEYGLHRVVRRAHVLDSLLCGAAELELQIGALLAAGRPVRPLVAF
jgi:hypothetical protein